MTTFNSPISLYSLPNSHLLKANQLYGNILTKPYQLSKSFIISEFSSKYSTVNERFNKSLKILIATTSVVVTFPLYLIGYSFSSIHDYIKRHPCLSIGFVISRIYNGKIDELKYLFSYEYKFYFLPNVHHYINVGSAEKYWEDEEIPISDISSPENTNPAFSLTFFHGTTKKAASSVQENGFDIKKTDLNHAVYGWAVYAALDKAIAEKHGKVILELSCSLKREEIVYCDNYPVYLDHLCPEQGISWYDDVFTDTDGWDPRYDCDIEKVARVAEKTLKEKGIKAIVYPLDGLDYERLPEDDRYAVAIFDPSCIKINKIYEHHKELLDHKKTQA